MKTTIMAIVAVLFLISVICTLLSFSKSNRSGRLLGWSSLFSAFLHLAYIIIFSTDSFELMAFLRCAQFAFVDCLFFCLFEFVFEYIQKPLKKAVTIVVASIATLDCILFLTNSANGYVLSIKEFSYADIHSVAETFHPLYYLHLVLCYGLCLSMIVATLVKSINTQRLYRAKYRLIMIILIASMFGSAVPAYVVKDIINIGDVMLTVVILVIYLGAFSSSKKKLISRLHVYVDNNISDATILYDNQGVLLNINNKAVSLFERDICETSERLLTYLGFPDVDGTYKKKIREGTYNVSIKALNDENDYVIGKTFIFHDITDVETQVEREHEIAITDPLTGANNRLGFLEASNDYLYKNESEAGFAMIVSGIKNFKGLNATFGTRAGDLVLKYIERRYHDYLNSYPMVYGRTAESKYAVLVPFDAVDEITSAMTCIDVPIDADLNIHVDMCHGFMVLTDIGKPLDYYYERAQLALSECKRNLTSTTLEYSFEMEEKVQRRQYLVTQMHEAIRENQFFIELQPQINLETREVTGAEALVRWQHPKLGRIAPFEFIPLFEENGFIVDLDVHIWEKAARTVKELADKGLYNGSVSVNISQIDIMNIDVPAALERIVNKVGLSPDKLHVEITESACVDRRETLIRTMDALREKGFIIEIDDFGSGYSSLNVLMSLPFDVVKLDMAFMKEGSMDGRNGIVIETIANMIHALEATIIVEGVETENNVENTVRFGGDIVQGYYFSRPLSVDSFVEFVGRK